MILPSKGGDESELNNFLSPFSFWGILRFPPPPPPCSCSYRCDYYSFAPALDLLLVKVHSQLADPGDCHPSAKQHQLVLATTSTLLEMSGRRRRTWCRGFPLLLPFRGPPHWLSMPPSHEHSRGSIKLRACHQGKT